MGYTWEDPFNSLSFDELQDNKQCILLLFFSNDAKIINHSWISKSYVLIGYPSKKDEPICQTCESPSSHFTRLDQLHASGNTFINLLVIVSLEIKKHFSISFKYQCNKKSMHMSILFLFCSHCYSNDAMERNR